MDVNTVPWGSHNIRLMPGWDADFETHMVDDEPAPGFLGTVCQPSQTDGKDLLDATKPGPFGLGVAFSVGHPVEPRTPEGAAVTVAAGMLAATFHEVIEWVTVDGERLADPHPSGDDQWEWTMDRLVELVREYQDRWPVAEKKGS